MGYADNASATGSSGLDRILIQTAKSRFAGANGNVRQAHPQIEARRPATAIRTLLEEWSLESFQRERTALDRVRSARPVAAFVQALYATDESMSRHLFAMTCGESGCPQEAARLLMGPAAVLIGRDWETDASDFLRVTIAMSRLQLLFKEAVAATPPAAPRDPARRLLLAPAPGNQHGFGLAVAEDAFRREGWMVEGGACAGDELLGLAAARSYRIIGLSVGDDRTMRGLGAFVTALRCRSRNRSVVLLAGGSLAARDPQSLLAAGFDRVFAEAGAAVREAAAVDCPAAPS